MLTGGRSIWLCMSVVDICSSYPVEAQPYIKLCGWKILGMFAASTEQWRDFWEYISTGIHMHSSDKRLLYGRANIWKTSAPEDSFRFRRHLRQLQFGSWGGGKNDLYKKFEYHSQNKQPTLQDISEKCKIGKTVLIVIKMCSQVRFCFPPGAVAVKQWQW